MLGKSIVQHSRVPFLILQRLVTLKCLVCSTTTESLVVSVKGFSFFLISRVFFWSKSFLGFLMTSRRRQQGQGTYSLYSQQQRHHPWTNDRSRRHDNSFTSVPYWEKKFCMTIGLIPWGKLVETKKCMSLHKNIVEWNDSAGEEAFKKAKSRFWAQMNGLIPSSDLSLPDPNAYIDDIDWQSSTENIDPQLILDLEKSKEHKPDNDHGDAETLDHDREFVIIGLHPVNINQTTLPCSGWGKEFEEEDLKNNENNNIPENPWEPVWVRQREAAAMGRGWNNTTSWEQWEKNNYNYNSRYKKSRFHGG